MAAAADLREVADTLAAKAKEVVGREAYGATEVGNLARASKVALEAAQVAGDVPAGEITEALAGLQQELIEADLFEPSTEMDPEAFLRLVFQSMRTLRQAAAVGRAALTGYNTLEQFLKGYVEQVEAAAADDEGAARVAARIRVALEQAAEPINAAMARENERQGAATGN